MTGARSPHTRGDRAPVRASGRVPLRHTAPGRSQGAEPNPPKGPRVGVLTIILKVLLVLTSIFLILSILLHKGKGGGLSDMFGGGISSSAGSSGVAERNLDRITVAFAITWAITIVGLGLIAKFA